MAYVKGFRRVLSARQRRELEAERLAAADGSAPGWAKKKDDEPCDGCDKSKDKVKDKVATDETKTHGE